MNQLEDALSSANKEMAASLKAHTEAISAALTEQAAAATAALEAQAAASAAALEKHVAATNARTAELEVIADQSKLQGKQIEEMRKTIDEV